MKKGVLLVLAAIAFAMFLLLFKTRLRSAVKKPVDTQEQRFVDSNFTDISEFPPLDMDYTYSFTLEDFYY